MSESVYYPSYYKYDYAYAMAETVSSAGSSTEIFGGEVEITANVDATFEIR